jgi:hypothetical protein
VLVLDVGSYAAASDHTRANMKAGASSPGTSEVLFATGGTTVSGGAQGVTNPLQPAHSETVGARAKVSVRKQRQVSTTAVTRPGYYRSTPGATAGVSRLLCSWTARLEQVL